VKSPQLALISAVLLSSLSSTIMATNAPSTHYNELKTEIKVLKDLKDPNINKIYEKIHLITSDGIITAQEKRELKLLINSHKKQLVLPK
jgi:hypothetical protein